MPSTTLIASPAGRAARIATKRDQLLRFLRKNHYTSADVAGLLMDVRSRQGVHATLMAMERDGLIRRETVQAHSRDWTLWGITAHGQAMAFDPVSGEQPESRYFEVGRVGLSVLAHTLDLQRIGITIEKKGWTDWQLGDQLNKWQAGMSRPDALVTSPLGERLAVECERTIKTVKRYEVILSDRLLAIKRGQFQRCVWLCPTHELAIRLKAIITSIRDVNVAGSRVPIVDRHLALLTFGCFQDVVKTLGESTWHS